MTKMLALITKCSKGAYPDVETEASRENRQRARAVTEMLARLAEHAAESDMHFLMANDTSKTNAEREQCSRVARQEDRAFMHELHEFRNCAQRFKSEPVNGSQRTDNSIVLEIETCLRRVQVLQDAQRSARVQRPVVR